MDLSKRAPYGRELLQKRHRIIRFRTLYRQWWVTFGNRAAQLCAAMDAIWARMSEPERILIRRGEPK